MSLDTILAALTDEGLDPLFWRPARLGVDSAWYGHVPFAHWIVGVHRPASVVELGSHNGVSYAAFCEAVLRGRLPTRAMAVDTWQGDEHAGFYDDSVYRDLLAFHDGRYAAFSTLLRSTFDDALRFVPDNSIDLLHIDGRHRYEDVSHDFATWHPKMSARGVVLFHDTNVYEGDFGVWRLWSELRTQHPSFEFLHGHGLGVIALGEAVDGPAAALCALDGAAVNTVRERFAMLGDRWIAARDFQHQLRATQHVQAERDRIGHDLSETRKWAEVAQNEVNRLFPQYQQLTEQHRNTRASLSQARFDIAARDWQVAELRNEAEALAADLDKTRQSSEHAAGQLALTQTQLARALQHGNKQDAEIASLKDMAANDRSEVARLQQQLASIRHEAAGLAGQIAASAQKLELSARHQAALEHQRAVLLGSTSWRITAPVRGLAHRVRGRPAATPAPLLALAAPQVDLLPLDTPPLSAADASPATVEQPVSFAKPFERPAEIADRADPDAASPNLPVQAEKPAAEVPAPEVPHRPHARPRALFISGEGHTPGHFYRVERYVEAARRAGFDAEWTPPEPVGPAELAGVRLVVLWRVPFSPHIQGIITVTHEQGGIAVFDVDDLMFRPDMATVDIIDGIRSQKFSEYETHAFFNRIAKSLQACDLVTCPTEELAHQARRLGRPAAVLPNGFDEASHAAARAAKAEWLADPDDLLRIGYAGGSRTHQRDFAVAVPAIARVLRERPDTRLTLFRDGSSGEGLVLIDEFPELREVADRIEWRNMVPLADLPREVARFAVNIAPLQADNLFCEAKSELKFFEAALAGVPTIASPSGPFVRAIIDGQTGYLAVSEQEWYTALRLLLDNAPHRTRMAQAAYHISLAQFGPEARENAFLQMMAQIEGGQAGAAAFQCQRYHEALPRLTPPSVPDSDIVFATDRSGTAEVTVVIPVFNYADYVIESLASVAAQSIAEIDLVVVDDHSPDDSLPMIQKWAQLNASRFNRLTLLRHRANAGLGFARNSGFAAAETAYVLPLDADNRLRPTACETLLRHLHGSRAAFAYPAIQQFGDKTDIFGQEPYSVLRLQVGNYIDAMALVRKSAWAQAGGYDHIQYGWEDFDFWCRLAERGQFGHSVPELLADYRVHGQSMLHTSTEIHDNRALLVRDLQARHPWLDLQ